MQLSAIKTDLIWFRNRQRLSYSFPIVNCVGSDVVSPSTVVREHGVYINAETAPACQPTRQQLLPQWMAYSGVFQLLITVQYTCKYHKPCGLLHQCSNRSTGPVSETYVVYAKCGCKTDFGLKQRDHITSALHGYP